MIPLDDNKINAKSTEITDLTYQYDDKKISSEENFLCFLCLFFFPDIWERSIDQNVFSNQDNTFDREPRGGSIFKIYICLESQILVCKTGVSKAPHYVLGNSSGK